MADSFFQSKIVDVIHGLFKSHTDEAEEYIDIVFEAASKKDEDALYNLFSEEVKEELGEETLREETLREQVKDLIQFYKGTKIKSREGVIEESTHNEFGVKRICIQVYYGIETDNGDYEFTFQYIARSDTNQKEAGFESFQIAKSEMVLGTPEFKWGVNDENHGIVIVE